MSQFTSAWYYAKVARELNARAAPASGVDREKPLHQEILGYCQAQWPVWPVIHARMDKRSTIGVGTHDITIFLPHGRVLCIECKNKDGKLDPDQMVWAKQMEMCGHAVHVVRSFSEFMELLPKDTE